MKKLIFIAILLPFTTYAAWWNPLTWFSDPTYETASVVQIETETPVKEPTPVEPEIVEVVKEVEVEKPVIKEVVKTETITVQDPALQVRINQLVSENSSLRSQLLSVQSELGQCRMSLGSKSAIDEHEAELARKAAIEEAIPCDNAKADYLASTQEIEQLNLQKIAEKEEAEKTYAGSWGGALDIKLDDIEEKYQDLISVAAQKRNTASAQMKVYCSS